MEQSWNAKLYDTKHAFVSNYGNEVLEWLDPSIEEKILDLGCGTGDIVKELHDAGVKKIKGIDASKNMIMQAREKYPALSFDVKDATTMTFEEEFDAVFSNAVLHWVKEPDKALDSMYRSLKSGGRFVAEFGGKENAKR
ncbi:class I SAM-dependent methyltransferase [Salibacterium salarium]|uniref:class I SAM-dependent methyltransferase n=1 Tax=Salibacterium salarium TaxID=284579 RepID=UPI0026BBE509